MAGAGGRGATVAELTRAAAASAAAADGTWCFDVSSLPQEAWHDGKAPQLPFLLQTAGLDALPGSSALAHTVPSGELLAREPPAAETHSQPRQTPRAASLSTSRSGQAQQSGSRRCRSCANRSRVLHPLSRMVLQTPVGGHRAAAAANANPSASANQLSTDSAVYPAHLFERDGFTLDWLVIDVSDSRGLGLGGKTGRSLFELFVQGSSTSIAEPESRPDAAAASSATRDRGAGGSSVFGLRTGLSRLFHWQRRQANARAAAPVTSRQSEGEIAAAAAARSAESDQTSAASPVPAAAASSTSAAGSYRLLVSDASTLVFVPQSYSGPSPDALARAAGSGGARTGSAPSTAGSDTAAAAPLAPSAAARKGSGLGLALTASLIERMGGHVALAELADRRTHCMMVVPCPMRHEALVRRTEHVVSSSHGNEGSASTSSTADSADASPSATERAHSESAVRHASDGSAPSGSSDYSGTGGFALPGLPPIVPLLDLRQACSAFRSAGSSGNTGDGVTNGVSLRLWRGSETTAVASSGSATNESAPTPAAPAPVLPLADQRVFVPQQAKAAAPAAAGTGASATQSTKVSFVGLSSLIAAAGHGEGDLERQLRVHGRGHRTHSTGDGSSGQLRRLQRLMRHNDAAAACAATALRVDRAAPFSESEALWPASPIVLQLIAAMARDEEGTAVTGSGRSSQTASELLQQQPVNRSRHDAPSASARGIGPSMPIVATLTASSAAAESQAWPCVAHVLVVDDDATNRRLAARLLARLHCTNDLLEDGDQVALALERTGQLLPSSSSDRDAVGLGARMSTTGTGIGAQAGPGRRAGDDARPYNFCLLDQVMVGSVGSEVVAQLQARGCTLPIFAMTANASAVDQQRYVAAGMDSFIVAKPFSTATLQKAVDIVQARRTRATTVDDGGTSAAPVSASASDITQAQAAASGRPVSRL